MQQGVKMINGRDLGVLYTAKGTDNAFCPCTAQLPAVKPPRFRVHRFREDLRERVSAAFEDHLMTSEPLKDVFSAFSVYRRVAKSLKLEQPRRGRLRIASGLAEFFLYVKSLRARSQQCDSSSTANDTFSTGICTKYRDEKQNEDYGTVEASTPRRSKYSSVSQPHARDHRIVKGIAI